MRMSNHKNSQRIFVAASLLAVLLLLSWMLVQMNYFGTNLWSPANAPGTNLALQTLYQKLPLCFEPNLGQMSGEALFRSQGPGYTLLLTARQAILSMNAAGNPPKAGQSAEAILRISPVAMNPESRLIPENPQVGKANYFLKVLTELVGSLPGMTKGYFEVRSDLPVASFALFGTNNGEVLSAIPSQPRSGN